MTERFSAEDALRPLKAFQRTTVDYVSRRLLTDTDSVRHFLVADEVGLGKTMVARGVIARTIEALQDTVPRIDIVYICSNGAIAKQNISRLNVMGDTNARVLPTRLTMLALELARAGGIKRHGVNFFSLTPGTSLDLKQGGGMKQERALILKLLWDHLVDRRAVAKMLQGYAGAPGWRSTRDWIDAQPIELQIAERFRKAVDARPELLRELEDCAQCYKGLRQNDTDLNRRREALVGAFRTILARESAEALEPDLIVLDEFQRFTDLLHGEGEAAELARRLFDAQDPQGNRAKVLLLSATPYRMLSLREDDADAGDHYREFLDVLGFLFGERGPAVRAELETEMRRFRSAIQSLPGSFEAARQVKTGIEGTLRQVIARTERVSETAQRDAMMRDVDVPVTVEPADLIEARAVARVADAADAPGTVEYWKSAPYLLNFLRDYKLGQRLEHLKDSPSEALVNAIRAAKSAQIDIDAVENYRPIPENNGRIRALKTIAFQDDMAKRLWVPPSLPYFGPRVSASKLLIFSQWAMVPDAIAALLSYNSELAMGMEGLKHRYSDAFRKQTQPLSFRRAKERLTGLRALTLVIPSPTLAAAADPLDIFRSGAALTPRNLAGWAKRCDTPERRQAVLNYLVRGEKSAGVAEELKAAWPHWLPRHFEDLCDSDLTIGLERALLQRHVFPHLYSREHEARLDGMADQGLPTHHMTEETFIAPPEPEAVLERLHEWWKKNSLVLSGQYTRATYPDRLRPKSLRDKDVEDDPEAWFTFFAQAVFRTLDWGNATASRNFIEQARSAGWWGEMAGIWRQHSYIPWTDRLEELASTEGKAQDYRRWRRALGELYVVARWLPEYVEVFRLLPKFVKRDGQISLRDHWWPSASPAHQRRGTEGASLIRSLGIGANWMIREAVREKVWGEDSGYMHGYGWGNSAAMQRFAKQVRWQLPDSAQGMDSSLDIHEMFSEILGDRASFEGALDLPVQLLMTSRHKDDWLDIFGPAAATDVADELEEDLHS